MGKELDWKLIREGIIKRDKVCQRCSKNTRLVVHHKDRSGSYPDANNSPDNLIAYCHSCHGLVHKEMAVAAGFNNFYRGDDRYDVNFSEIPREFLEDDSIKMQINTQRRIRKAKYVRKTKHITRTYVMSDEHIEKVKQLAKLLDRSESSVVRQAVDAYYEVNEKKKV